MRYLLIACILSIFIHTFIDISVKNAITANSPVFARIQHQIDAFSGDNARILHDIYHYEALTTIDQEAQKLGFFHSNELFLLPPLDK